MVRKINTRSTPAKAVSAPVLKKGLRKVQVAVKAKPAPTSPVRAESAAPAPKRFTHPVKSEYAGVSQGFNRGRSRTKVPNAEFGHHPDLVLHDRTNGILAPLKKAYGGNVWVRGNLDAAVLKYGVWKGHVQPVSGAGESELDTYRFTKEALAVK